MSSALLFFKKTPRPVWKLIILQKKKKKIDFREDFRRGAQHPAPALVGPRNRCDPFDWNTTCESCHTPLKKRFLFFFSNVFTDEIFKFLFKKKEEKPEDKMWSLKKKLDPFSPSFLYIHLLLFRLFGSQKKAIWSRKEGVIFDQTQGPKKESPRNRKEAASSSPLLFKGTGGKHQFLASNNHKRRPSFLRGGPQEKKMLWRIETSTFHIERNGDLPWMVER